MINMSDYNHQLLLILTIGISLLLLLLKAKHTSLFLLKSIKDSHKKDKNWFEVCVPLMRNDKYKRIFRFSRKKMNHLINLLYGTDSMDGKGRPSLNSKLKVHICIYRLSTKESANAISHR